LAEPKGINFFFYFFLDKKVKKIKSARGFFLARALCAAPKESFGQSRQNLGWNLFALLRSLITPRFSKNPLCPAPKESYGQPHRATIVLPAFARSFLLTGAEET
jgi:hypothetical protein